MLGIARLIVAGQTGGRVGGILDTGELQLLDHEACDNLLIATHLESPLLCEQLRLAHQESDQSDPVIGELIVNVPEPLVRIFRLSLCLIAEKHDDMAATCGEVVPEAVG